MPIFSKNEVTNASYFKQRDTLIPESHVQNIIVKRSTKAHIASKLQG